MFSWILIFLLNLSPAHAVTAQNGVISSDFKKGYYSVGAELTYLSTSANYSDHSTSIDFDNGYGYSAFQTLIYGRYDLTDELSFYTELPLNYTMSENLTDKFSSFRAAGLAFGGNFTLDLSFVKLIPELKGYYSIEKYDRSADDVLTSDAASYVDAGSHIFATIYNLGLHGYLSYTYRTEGFSSLMNYQTDLSFKAVNSIFTLGLKGFESIKKDEHTGNPAYRNTLLDTVNGSSLLYASVNPSRLDLFGQAKFPFSDSIDIYGGVAKSIRGKNSGDILTAMLGFEYFFEPLAQKSLKEKYLDATPTENFQSQDEVEENKVEKDLSTYSQPAQPVVKKIQRKKKVIRKKKFTPKNSLRSPRLRVSEKELGTPTTNTSPIKTKPRSKKLKRVKVEF